MVTSPAMVLRASMVAILPLTRRRSRAPAQGSGEAARAIAASAAIRRGRCVPAAMQYRYTNWPRPGDDGLRALGGWAQAAAGWRTPVQRWRCCGTKPIRAEATTPPQLAEGRAREDRRVPRPWRRVGAG